MVANVSTQNILGVNLTQTTNISTATPEYPGNPFSLGTSVKATDGSEYIYAVATAAAIPLGSAVYFDVNWNAVLITTTNGAGISGSRVGFASQVPFAIADRGWFQIAGICPAILVSASTAAFAQLYTTATAGQLSSTATSSLAINGAVINTTAPASAGVVAGTLNYPELVLTT